MNSDLEGIPPEYLDKYGLVKLDNLEEITVDPLTQEILAPGSPGKLAFRLKDPKYKDLILFPKKEAGCVTGYLSRYQNVGTSASLRLTLGCTMTSGAEIWGITFKEALTTSRKQNLVRSIYYALDESIYRDYGVVVYFVIHLNRFFGQEDDQELIQLQAWQGRSDFPNILYLHAYFDEDFTYCSHLDGAIIEINTSYQAELYWKGRKVKGEKKEKLFRIDGSIPIEDFYEISEDFFPVSPLLKEYFGDSDQAFVVRGQREDGSSVEGRIPITPIDSPRDIPVASANSTKFAELFLDRFNDSDS